jgi:hypothetical protein
MDGQPCTDFENYTAKYYEVRKIRLGGVFYFFGSPHPLPLTCLGLQTHIRLVVAWQRPILLPPGLGLNGLSIQNPQVLAHFLKQMPLVTGRLKTDFQAATSSPVKIGDVVLYYQLYEYTCLKCDYNVDSIASYID